MSSNRIFVNDANGRETISGISRELIESAIRDVVSSDDTFKRLRRMDWTLIRNDAKVNMSGASQVKTNLSAYETFEPLCLLPAAMMRIFTHYVDWATFGYSNLDHEVSRAGLMAADVGYFLAVLHRAEQGGIGNLRKYMSGVISVMRRGASADSIKTWKTIDADTLAVAVSQSQKFSSIAMTNLYFAMIAMISYYLTSVLPTMRQLAVMDKLPWHDGLATATWSYYRTWRGVPIDGKPRDGMGDHGVRSGVALYRMRFVNGEIESGGRKLLSDPQAVGDQQRTFFKFLCKVK